MELLEFLQIDHKELPELKKLQTGKFYPALLTALRNLNREVLHKSRIHGEKHIERTILFGAMLAEGEGLSWSETELLLDACAYHDIGRIHDHYDPSHGARSAENLSNVVKRQEKELRMVQAAVKAHSLRDDEMDTVLAEYGLSGDGTAKRVMILLKDADALDRYRISPEDLDVGQLRSETSRKLLRFARTLNGLYYVE